MKICQGAEATLKKQGNKLIKERIQKNYRIKEIDGVLRKERTKKEAKLLNEVRRYGVKAPIVFSKDLKKMTIEMEFLKGDVLRDRLDKLTTTQQKKVCSGIGTQLKKMHSDGIIHGDLTTSNIILKENKTDEIYFIDFGLSFSSKKIEDKAVDLHLIKRAFISKHNKIWEKCFKSIISSYGIKNTDTEKILKRLEKIEKRGRYSK